MLPLKLWGRVRRTVAGSSGVARATPMKSLIDERDAARGGEVGVAQRQAQRALRAEREADLALDQAARGDAAGGRHARDDGGGVALGLEAVDGHRALGDGVDFAVGAEQRRHQQRAALQAVGSRRGRRR